MIWFFLVYKFSFLIVVFYLHSVCLVLNVMPFSLFLPLSGFKTADAPWLPQFCPIVGTLPMPRWLYSLLTH